jgi:hypothetical protein
VSCPESDREKQKPPPVDQNARGSGSSLDVEYPWEVAMKGQADSRRKAPETLVARVVGAALVMSLATRCFIQRENIRRVLLNPMRKLCGSGVFVFGRQYVLRPKLTGELSAFQNELDSAVLSDFPTAAEPINPRFRPLDVVHRARHSMGRGAQFSLPRDEIPPCLLRCSSKLRCSAWPGFPTSSCLRLYS